MGAIAVYLLVRNVSAYSFWDPVFLGIFSDPEKAESGRQAYIDTTHGNDSLEKQAYHAVNLHKDVCASAIPSHLSAQAGPTVFLVTRHLESMGQTWRWYLAIYPSLEEAGVRAAIEAETQVVAEYISVEEIVVNDTRYFEHSPFTEYGGGLWTGNQPGYQYYDLPEEKWNGR